MGRPIRGTFQNKVEIETPIEEVGCDVPNSDHEDHRIIVNHLKLNDNSQQGYGIGYHENGLNMSKVSLVQLT
ncbi:hypothetical protein PVK06_033637 [Gossypium arboreum]|uniref:Uncharacterized protein n=1 Tax=Gossypium arboreum TaxID=29729 RepID=A0ABR0NBZ1_GOSAR|nr:hypothetical protein PVK06_033637 [Gossypium arboreum]